MLALHAPVSSSILALTFLPPLNTPLTSHPAIVLALTTLISVIPALFSYPAQILALTSFAYHSAIILTLTFLNSLISALTSYSAPILALTSLTSLICDLSTLNYCINLSHIPSSCSPLTWPSFTNLFHNLCSCSSLSLGPHSCTNCHTADIPSHLLLDPSLIHSHITTVILAAWLLHNPPSLTSCTMHILVPALTSFSALFLALTFLTSLIIARL